MHIHLYLFIFSIKGTRQITPESEFGDGDLIYLRHVNIFEIYDEPAFLFHSNK